MPKSPVEGKGAVVEFPGQAKGILKALSEGLRTLLVIDEKIAALGKEADAMQTEVRASSEHLYHLIGKVEEMEKRFSDRMADLDKRLVEIDKRIDLQVQVATRDYLDRSSQPGNGPRGAK